MLLRKLISDVEEERSRLANIKLSLEESCEQVTPLYFSTDTAQTLIFPIIIFMLVDEWEVVSEDRKGQNKIIIPVSVSSR